MLTMEKSMSFSFEQIVQLDTDTSHLRFLEAVTLGPTSGNVTLAQSGDVFPRFLDSDFKNQGTDKPGQATDEQRTFIYEMKKDGTFADLFGSFDLDLCTLCWRQEQIRLFCQQHRHLLRQDSYGTFFLFGFDKKLFVSNVNVVAGQLGADVNRFSSDLVWSAAYRRRVVVPQQNL